jgi:hypothetical protein
LQIGTVPSKRAEMNRIQGYRRKSIGYLVAFALVGVVFFIAIMRYIKIGVNVAPMILLAVAWVIFYVNYLNLKTKAEILTELEQRLRAKKDV